MLTTHKKGSEDKLLEIVNSIKDDAQDFYAMQLNFSDLLEHYKNEYQLKISVNIINDLLRDAKGWVVVTSNYDIFIVCKRVDPRTMKKLIFQLRYLYMDDPLAYDEKGDDNEKFATIYDLAQDWPSFFSTVRAKIKLLQAEKPQKVFEVKPQTLTPEKLMSIEAMIGKSNIAPALRQQPICIENNEGLRIMFTETYINMGSLTELLGANVDFASNRWLFKYFTELLDIRVIELLKKTPKRYLARPVSLNFNVQTLLTDVFSEFANRLEAGVKKNIVIEIHVADIFTDMLAFQTARGILQSHGFRLCLDGMDALSFRQLDRNSLGFDFAKMFWNADMKADVKTADNVSLYSAINRCGKSRVILCRCDSAEAIAFGKKLGISLFQGRYIDKQINPDAEFTN